MDERFTEQTLVSRLRLGDQSAMPELEASYGSKIYQLAMRYMRNHEDAEEVRQDVLLRVFQKIGAFRGDAALSSWIYRITFNTAMSRLRSAKFSRPREVAEADLRRLGSDGAGDETRPSWDAPDWSSLADDVLYRGQLRRRLVDALGELPLIYRMPVVLRDVQGLSTEETSAILKVKPQTLKSRLHRGRLILRARLAEFSDGLTLHTAA